MSYKLYMFDWAPFWMNVAFLFDLERNNYKQNRRIERVAYGKSITQMTMVFHQASITFNTANDGKLHYQRCSTMGVD